MSISITVSGSASASYPPEEAHVSLSVTAQGPQRADVAQQVAHTHAQLSVELTELTTAGAVRQWSSGNVTTYSFHPHEEPTKARRMVQVATVSVEATFADLQALSPSIDSWFRDPLISLNGIDWRLTKANLEARAAEVRREAVQSAVSKAQSYSDALGAGPVEPVEIADVGMLPGGDGPRGAMAMVADSSRAFQAGFADQSGVELRPRDIDVNVSVDARFTAQL